jgi:hypothetical protein
MRFRNGAIAGVLASALAAWQLRDLARLGTPAGTAVVGPVGDNLAFVWNTWWAAHALKGPAFSTNLLFAPWGTTLVLHTHAWLPSVLAAALPGLSPVGATDAIIAFHLFLNVVCVFALAGRATTRLVPRSVAALAFAWSPFIGAHLAGHFNLMAAWVLPLTVLLLLRALEKGRAATRLVTGLAFGAVAYVDYYLFIYAVCLTLVILLARSGTFTRRDARPRQWQRPALLVCGALLAIDIVVLAVILVTGGGSVAVAGVKISLHGTENPSAAAGILTMVAIAVAALPRVRIRIDGTQLRRDAAMLSLSAASGAVVLMPLAVAAFSLWRNGGYVSQTYYWRSAPAGVDLATLVLGNPFGVAWGSVATTLYARMGIDVVERVAWLGPGVLALVAAAITLRWRDRDVRLWTVVALVFGVWALGPRLQAFGRDLHVFLPAVLLRYVPLAANARMPGRAILVVYLASAMLAAVGLDALSATGRRGLAWTLAALTVLDCAPKPPGLYRPDHPAIYDTLARQAGAGSVCELPMGLRDGFGETGRLDMRTMYYQTLYGRPMTGGFVARLDPRLAAAYQQDPVLGVLLRLSGGAPLAAQRALPPRDAATLLQREGIRFVMLNRATAPPDLVQYVESGLPLRTIQNDADRTLFEVAAPVNATAGSQRP